MRVWPLPLYSQRQMTDFNSHTREGVTLCGGCAVNGDRGFQLTHPWGCDGSMIAARSTSSFQLTHPWGCDAAVNRNIPYSGIFQLTHSWGCDCTSPEPDINRNNHFNSHTREGVTYYLAYSRLPIKGFQLTHPWGCDFWRRRNYALYFNFNSHTREGVTYHRQKDWETIQFQLTHPWGCDLICDKSKILSVFQLTHPWGCDIF